MENTEEIYTDFARVYDELMDNKLYEMWCTCLDQLDGVLWCIQTYADAEGIPDRAESGGGSGLRQWHFDRTILKRV